jgi:death-on-curing protein
VRPRFLTLAEILRIHQDQIKLYGGNPGIHDLGLLESAIAVPQATFGGQHLYADLFEMAAAYLYHLCQNHPFSDGNKRTAAVAARVFLRLNGYDLRPAEPDFEKLVLSVACGKKELRAIAGFLKVNSSEASFRDEGTDSMSPDPP